MIRTIILGMAMLLASTAIGQTVIWAEDFEKCTYAGTNSSTLLANCPKWLQISSAQNQGTKWIAVRGTCNISNSSLGLGYGAETPVNSFTFFCGYSDAAPADNIAYYDDQIFLPDTFGLMEFQFDWTGTAEPGFDFFKVVYSTDAVTWQDVNGVVYDASPGITNETIDISGLMGGNYYFGFQWINDETFAGSGVSIDDIQIVGLDGVFADFDSDEQIGCPGTTIQFNDRSTGSIQTYDWSVNPSAGVTISDPTVANPTITFSNTGLYDVTLTVTGGNNSDTETKFQYIDIQASRLLPFVENFETGTFRTNRWSLESDGPDEWLISSAGGNPGSGASAYVDHWFGNGARGDYNSMITPSLNLDPYDSVYLSFVYSYALQGQEEPFNRRDTLIVSYSIDCGETYTQLPGFYLSESVPSTGNFVTRPQTQGVYTPVDSSDWCFNGAFGAACFDSVLVQDLAGAGDQVKVKFTLYHGSLAHLWMDDIRIDGFTNDLEASFSADPTETCIGAPVQFTNESAGNAHTYDWTFQGGTPGTSTQENPVVTYATSGLYDVKLVVCDTVNGVCDSLLRTNYIKVNPNIDLPYGQDFEAGVFTDWIPSNPDGDIGWNIKSTAGNNPGNKSAFMDFYNYPATGELDYLTSPGFDFTPYDSVFLEFDHAYAPRQGGVGQNDTLRVQVSTNCGSTWQTVLTLVENGSNSFATSSPDLQEFSPTTPSDWCFEGLGNCNLINLSTFAGLEGVKIRFATTNANGNNLFLDDVFLYGNEDAVPEAKFFARPRFVCLGDTVVLTSTSTGNPDRIEWTFQGGNPAMDTVNNQVKVVYDSIGNYSVRLVVENELGRDAEVKSGYIRVGNGLGLPLVEDFENNDLNDQGWLIESDDSEKFTVVTTGGTTPGTKSLKMPWFGYNAIGARDYLISPPMDFGDWDSISFTFEHAYQPIGATSSPDTLMVEFSTDCGKTWAPLRTFVHTGTGTFGTVAPGTGDFTPSQESDWCISGTPNTPCTYIDLNAFLEMNQLKVRFHAINGGGNNLYLDNISITGHYVGEPPVASFVSEYPIACVGEEIKIFDTSENEPTSWQWSFPGGTPSQSTSQNPSVTYSQPGLYSVALIAKNFFGNDTTIVQDYIKVVEPRLLPFTENFETGDFGTNDWYTVSPGGGKKWRIDTASGNGGGLAAVFKHFNNGNGVGEYDHLVSPPFNLSGYDSVMLDFEHAYQVYSTSAIDSLVVSYSTDCGSDWNRIASYGDDGSGSFATLLPSQTEFTPTKLADWCLSGTYGASCIGFDLTDETAGLDNVKFRFTTYSDGGNNLFIDNINITGVSSVPTANFKGDTTVICQNDSVLFINTSTPNATDFLWDFDGGMPGTSTDADPGYVTYDTPGLYTISLQASNQAGSDSRTKIDYIQVIPSPELSFTVVPAGCGQSNGSATVNVSGGMPPFTYVWDRIPASDTNATLSGAVGGTYSVTVTGANGCSTTAPVLINTSGNMQASIVQYKAVTCNGDADGALTAKGSLGLAPYTYEWNTGETSSSISGLSGGRYTCVVRDAAGCVQSVSTVVQEPGLLQVSLTGRNDDGSTNGQVNASVSGGTQPYTYVWNTGDSTASLDSLGQGLYTVNITDKNGCKVSAQYIVSYQPEITIHLDDLTNVSCNGQQDGSISVSASGGTAPYNFQWNTAPPQFTPTATGLGVGNYTVTVTDQLGVTQTMTVFVSEESPIVLNASATDDDGTMNGTATATVFSGGVPPYTFHWNTSPPQTTQTITALQEGFYMVTVTDSAGCTAAQTVQVVGSYQALNVNPNSVVDLKCNGDNDGSAEVNVSGGVPPYDYLWTTTPAQFTPKATNLSGGTYWVYVTDAYDNVDSLQVTVNEPAAMGCLVSSSPDDGSGNQGSATVNPFGGTPFPGNPQYSYSWDTQPVQLSQTATGLLPGFYTVTVTDANGCVCQATVEVDHDGTGVSQEELSEYIQVYPNPNSGRFNIALTLPKATDVDVIMTDGIGKRVYYQNHGKLGHDQIGMDIDNLPKGVYHLSIVSPEWQYNTRVVISD